MPDFGLRTSGNDRKFGAVIRKEAIERWRASITAQITRFEQVEQFVGKEVVAHAGKSFAVVELSVRRRHDVERRLFNS